MSPKPFFLRSVNSRHWLIVWVKGVQLSPTTPPPPHTHTSGPLNTINVILGKVFNLPFIFSQCFHTFSSSVLQSAKLFNKGYIHTRLDNFSDGSQWFWKYMPALPSDPCWVPLTVYVCNAWNGRKENLKTILLYIRNVRLFLTESWQ